MWRPKITGTRFVQWWCSFIFLSFRLLGRSFIAADGLKALLLQRKNQVFASEICIWNVCGFFWCVVHSPFLFIFQFFFSCVWCRQYIEFQKIDNERNATQTKWYGSLKCKFMKNFHLSMESNNVCATLDNDTTNLDIFFLFFSFSFGT